VLRGWSFYFSSACQVVREQKITDGERSQDEHSGRCRDKPQTREAVHLQLLGRADGDHDSGQLADRSEAEAVHTVRKTPDRKSRRIWGLSL
jgi:hypothetical protein